MLPGISVRFSAPGHCQPQHGQTTVGAQSVCRQRSGANDRLQASKVGISHHDQGACCELLMDVCGCAFNIFARLNVRNTNKQKQRNTTKRIHKSNAALQKVTMFATPKAPYDSSKHNLIHSLIHNRNHHKETF